MAEVISLDSEEKKTPKGWSRHWQSEFDAAKKRLRDFQKKGNRVTARYLDERASETISNDVPFRLNLFHTNISTLQSMLYGATPQIDVSREHADPDDDIARVAATLYQRLLQADVESSGEDLPTTLKAALQDRLLPGLGVARVRYTYQTTQVTTLNPETLAPEQSEQLEYEDVPTDYVHWQDFIWGWARTWAEVPWMGFRSWMTKDEVTERFDAKIAKNLEYKEQVPTGAEHREDVVDADQKNNVQKAEIWEFWDKKTRKCFWWSEGADYILDAQDDPLKLDGFWPVPMPMMANLTTTQLVPIADFVISQDLYNEIDELQSRISTITRAVKVVGVYDKSASNSVGRMLKEGVENDLIPVDNWAMFAEKGGLAGQIDWFPVQEVVNTLQTLRSLLGETIELLYQVTGMSDVLRGANTDQYTSDGTNQLKAKFGSIRIQALQDEFARFASDLEGLKAEVISKHFSPQSILKQSNARYMPQADMDKIEPAVQLMQSPDIKWRVNIRPESIALVDYAQLKSERVEYLTSVATFLQSATSMAKEVPQSLPILLEFLKFGMVGFKGSDYMEGMLDQAIDLAKNAPPPGQDDGAAKAEQAKAQLEQMKHQNEMQKIQAKAQSDMQLQQSKFQGSMQQTQMDNQSKLQQEQASSQADIKKIMVDLKADLQVIQAKLSSDLQVEAAQSEYAIAERQVEHAHNLTEEAQSHGNSMAQIDEQGDQNAQEED